MNRKRVLLTIQAVLCGITAIMLIAGAIMIYREGVIVRQDDPAASIYTVETITTHILPVLPVFGIAVILNIFLGITGVRDETADKAVMTVNVSRYPERSNIAGINAIRIVILALAAGFIVMGIFNGSMRDVFIKASKICTECIGLG